MGTDCVRDEKRQQSGYSASMRTRERERERERESESLSGTALHDMGSRASPATGDGLRKPAGTKITGTSSFLVQKLLAASKLFYIPQSCLFTGFTSSSSFFRRAPPASFGAR